VTRLLLCLAATALAASLAFAESPVGFRVIEKRDASRPLKDATAGRPIQIALWYPASGKGSSDAARMRFRDYMALGLSAKSFAAPAPEAVEQMLGEYRKFLLATGVDAVEAEALLATPMAAVRDAPAAEGSFPLVLLAPGNAQSAEDVAALAELLAARGFLAASVPSPTRISGPMQSEADIPEKADEQASDLGFARQALRAQAREGRIAVVGHSFGARSALLLAMRDSDVAAVVSLDGGIGAKTGAGLLEKSRGFSRERMRAALLHFYEELDPQMAPDFTLIRSLDRSDRWLVRVSGMHHIHFTTIGALIGASPGLFRATSASSETGPAQDSVLQATESFLSHFVDPRAERPARWQPPSSESLRVEALPSSH
jgi:dienelactone hydrolase